MTESEVSLRPLNCELNCLSVPDGSTMFMQGDTTVLAGVYGPIEAKTQKMFHNKANIETTFGPIKGPPSVNDRLMELYLRDTCEAAIITTMHPVSTISINIQEIQDCGGLLACAINASCLALINASISMKFTYAAVHSMIEKETNNIIMDPNSIQLKNAKATFTFGFDSVDKEIVLCHSSGQFSDKELLEIISKSKETSNHIFDFYRDIVTKYATAI